MWGNGLEYEIVLKHTADNHKKIKLIVTLQISVNNNRRLNLIERKFLLIIRAV